MSLPPSTDQAAPGRRTALSRGTRAVGVTVAAVLGVLVTTMVVGGLRERTSEPRADTTARAAQAVGSGSPGPGSVGPTREVAVSKATRAPANVEAQPPRVVVLPDGTGVPVHPATTRSNGVLDVPDGVRAAGWWDGSSQLGEPFGVVLVAGHVDSTTEGLGPFAQLLGVAPGDRVELRSASLQQRFAVRSLEVIPREALARRPELTAATGPPRLVLVTCAGPFVPDDGGYQALAVVTATPVASPRRTGGEQ